VDTSETRKIAEYLGRQNEEVRALGRELGVPVADIARDLPADPTVTFDDLHFTPEGDRLRAEIFLRTMEQEHIITSMGEHVP
jgi:lysophospholipase L1-like esterase